MRIASPPRPVLRLLDPLLRGRSGLARVPRLDEAERDLFLGHDRGLAHGELETGLGAGLELLRAQRRQGDEPVLALEILRKLEHRRSSFVPRHEAAGNVRTMPSARARFLATRRRSARTI